MDWVCGWIGNLRRLSNFIKYRKQPREGPFDHLWNFLLWRERASGWLFHALPKFSRVKDSHPSWCWERPLRSFKEIQWILIYRFKLQNVMDISSSALVFLPSQVFSPYFSSMEWCALGGYSSLWGSFSCSSILYSDVNYLLFNFRNISCLNSNKYHVLLINNEKTVPFPHYLVANSCNIDGFQWMYEILMIYEWIDYN